MRFIMLNFIFLFTSVCALEKDRACTQEKDYSLFDYHALLSEWQWRTFYQERTRLEKLSGVNWNLLLETAQINPHAAIHTNLYALKVVRGQYPLDEKLRAYQTAKYSMLMAKVLDTMPMSPARITKSQVKSAWRSNNKDVSRMMALCRKHPGDASKIIENFKRDVRTRLTLKLAK